MLKSYLVAILAISSMMVGWALVQRAWGRLFEPGRPGTDVLAQRRSCGNCGCAVPCKDSDENPDAIGRVSLDDRSAK